MFGNSAWVYATYVCAMIEWGKIHHAYGGQDPIPILPGWLTTFMGVRKELKTNADLPRKRVLVGHANMRLNSAGTWMWMVDLLQFWADLSGSRLYSGVFRYTSLLVTHLMMDINPSLDATHHITWEHVANNTPSWINAQVLFLTGKMEEFNCQKQHWVSLNELEKVMEDLYE